MAAGVGVRYGWLQSQSRSQSVYRIGYGSFPPYFVMSKSGTPSGFSVEVVREAARRLDIRLEWVRYTKTVEAALLSGEIDLFPMLAILPDRRGKMEFSDPWWENTLVVLSPASNPIRTVADTEAKRISLIHATFGLQRIKALFPKAIPVPEKEYQKVVQNVCTGASEGAIIETRLASGLSLLPQCANVEITQAWFPQLNLTYGVGARPGLKPVANRIQAEIVRMAQDGAMTRIGAPWGIQVTNQHQLLDSLVRGQVREQWLHDATFGIGILLALAIAVSYRLRQARLRAEQALLDRSQFIANISHEIRTPMNGLLGITQVLRDTDLSPRQRECVEVLETSGQSMMTLIDELLDFSKSEAGRITLVSVPFSPATLVKEVVQLFESRTGGKKLRLGSSFAPDLPPLILGDPFRLRQVLSNLVGNAVKFTEQGRIDIETTLIDGCLRFAVVDTGIGIHRQSIEKIFEPFTQADGSTSRQYGGTGLGLAISKNLVELMGGKLGVESIPGQGSRFWFDLPLVLPDPQAAAEPQPPAHPAPINAAPIGLHILIAEDNAVNQQVMMRHLEKLGCTFHLARNGLEALSAVAERSFDLILMDGQMPELDGFEATRRIRGSGLPSSQIPIIGVTACAFEEDRQRCLDSGMQAVLTKPFSLSSLEALLRATRDKAPSGGLLAQDGPSIHRQI